MFVKSILFCVLNLSNKIYRPLLAQVARLFLPLPQLISILWF